MPRKQIEVKHSQLYYPHGKGIMYVVHIFAWVVILMILCIIGGFLVSKIL